MHFKIKSTSSDGMKAYSIDATSPKNAAEPDPERRVICVRAESSFYAIELRYVECVLPLMELQPIPGGADYLVGMMNFRGKGLAVIDLALWLGLNRTLVYDLDTPVIICGSGDAQMAFIADEVLRIESVKPEAIYMQELLKESTVPLEASLKLGSGIVLLLDMPRILNVNFSPADSESGMVAMSLY